MAAAEVDDDFNLAAAVDVNAAPVPNTGGLQCGAVVQSLLSVFQEHTRTSIRSDQSVAASHFQDVSNGAVVRHSHQHDLRDSLAL
ncbi:MAG TPA: hypothetical protein DEP84_22940 [Chloroflexi bacterium]|nr:hypothetical protein [Chloroflexota bacterium]